MILPYWETDIEIELLKAGARRLVKRESVSASRVAAAVASFTDAGFLARAVPCATRGGSALSLTGSAPRGPVATVLVARDAEALREGVALEQTILSEECPGLERQQAKRLMGALLGYPACCVEAYLARGDFISMTEYFLAPYASSGTCCDPLLNPLTFLYFTCSCGCAEASKSARRALEIMAAGNADAAAKYTALSAMPVLFWDCDRHLFINGSARGSLVHYDEVISPVTGRSPRNAAARGFLKNAAALLRQGDNLKADIRGVHVRAGRSLVGTIPRRDTLYPAAVINPRVPDPELHGHASMAFINFHQPRHDYFLHSISNVLAGNIKELGGTASVYHFRQDPEQPLDPDALSRSLQDGGARLAVFHRTVMPDLNACLRERGIQTVYLGNLSRREFDLFDYLLEDYTRGKALDVLVSAMRGWRPRKTYPGPEPGKYFLEGYNPIPDTHVDEGARASFLWHVGPEYMCYYNRSVENNPLFAEFPVHERRRMRGCSYCNCHLRPLPLDDATNMVLHHILQTRKRVPGVTRFCVMLPMKGLCDLVERLPGAAQGIELWIECRVDDVHANRHGLETAAATARRKKIALVFFLLGIENFSPKELALFNKNVSVSRVEQSMDFLETLQRQFPESVLFRQLNTHGFILFNPWTTLDDLRINHEAILKHRMTELVENPYDKKLRLYANVPLFELARKHHLIPNADPDAWVSRLNYGADEVPWIFQDARVQAVWDLYHLAVPFVETDLDTTLFGLVLEDVQARGADNCGPERAQDIVRKIRMATPRRPGDRSTPGAGSPLQRLAGLLAPGAPVGPARVVDCFFRGPELLTIQLALSSRAAELFLNVNSRPDAPAYIKAGLFSISLRAEEGHIVTLEEDKTAKALKKIIQDAFGNHA